MPKSAPVQGRGGMHFRRTLASFSLEGRVGIVTGGARGLGLVMSQALVVSGADVAIVDLNSKSRAYHWQRQTDHSLEEEGERQAELLMQHFVDENPGAEKYVGRPDNLNLQLTASQCSQSHGSLFRCIEPRLRQRRN